MATKTIIECDICGKEVQKTYNYKKKNYGIIFTTEQTEGRGVKPYFTKEKLDLCVDCQEKLKEHSVQITGYGAMGNNTYKLVRMSLRNLDTTESKNDLIV